MDLFEKYYTYALKFLSYRPRSEKELLDALKKRQAPPEIIEKTVTLLKKQRFLNDDEFTKWWIEQRVSFRQRSKSVLKIELQQKGIAKETIQRFLHEEAETQVSDFDQALILAKKRISRYQGLEKQELYQKMGGMLARKGFTWDVIKKAIDTVVASE